MYAHPTERGTGEVESYTDSTANSSLIVGKGRPDGEEGGLQLSVRLLPAAEVAASPVFMEFVRQAMQAAEAMQAMDAMQAVTQS